MSLVQTHIQPVAEQLKLGAADVRELRTFLKVIPCHEIASACTAWALATCAVLDLMFVAQRCITVLHDDAIALEAAVA